jgi:hypothetical protein
VCTNYLVLVPTDPDAHPADRHPRTRRGVAPGVARLMPKTEAARPATRWISWTEGWQLGGCRLPGVSR